MMIDEQAKKRILEISRGLLSCPTAPFHEDQALHYIQQVLNSYHIPFKEDSGGNLIVHLQEGKKSLPIAFVAHTDHPGIEISKVTRKKAIGHVLGGVDLRMMVGSSVDLFTRTHKIGQGKIIKGELIRGLKTVHVQVPDPSLISPGDFGMFSFPGWRIRDRRIFSRAIDDLMGCAAILNLLIRQAKIAKNIDLYGIFTRAEEVGFIGSLHLIAQKTLPLNTLIVSVETSKAHPLATIGGGPVIRLGDKASLFDPEMGFYFTEVAERLSKKSPEFKFQRLLMTGGTCEATPFYLAGYKSFGIAFPLGNYHNMSLEGKIRPEYIDRSDFYNGILLMEALTKNLRQFKKGELRLKKRMKALYSRWKSRLTSRKN